MTDRGRRFILARQRDELCPACVKSHWFVLVSEKEKHGAWMCPVCKNYMPKSVCKELMYRKARF